MKIKYFILVISVLFLLMGCKEDVTETTPTPPVETEIVEETFLYRYQLHMLTYEELIIVETIPISKLDGEQRIEFKVSLKNPLDFAEDVTFDFKVFTKGVLFPDQTYEYTFQTTYNGRDNHIYIATYPDFRTLYDLQILKVSGYVKSHTSYDIIDPLEESTRLHKELKKDIDQAFSDNLMKLSLTQVIEMESKYSYQQSVIRTVIDLENFYFSVITDESLGTIILEKNNQFYLYQYFTYEYEPFVQLLAIFDEFSETDVETTQDFFFDEAWFYTYENGIYTIKATLGNLMRVIIDDEETVKNLVGSHENLEVVMEITVTDTNMTFNLTYKINQTTVKVRNYYRFDVANQIDISTLHHVPMNSPLFITEYTDMTTKLENQLYIQGQANYYVISLDEGLYALEDSNDLTIEFYDATLDLINLELDEHYQFQTRIKNIYHFDQGEYIVKVTYNGYRTFLYSLELVPLSKNYQTIVNIDEPITIEGDNLNIEIEGKYDYVIAEYTNNDEGLLYLGTDIPFQGNVYMIEDDGSFSKARIHTLSHGYLIHLKTGNNVILFENTTKAESISFTIDTYGVRYESGQTLSDTFPDEFVVSRPYEDIYYQFELNTPSMVTFEAILDPIYGDNVSRNYQIWSTTNYINQHLVLSFSMTSFKEIYLPEGKYLIRVMNLASIKLKGSSVPHTPITHVTADVLELESLQAFDQDSFAYLQSYQQYPLSDLTFEITLTEKTHLLVAYTSTRNYTLVDQEGRSVNFSHPSGHQLYVLSSGIYYLSMPKNQNFFMSEVKIGFYRVTDDLVLEDDNLYDYQNIESLALNTVYNFEKTYRADHEYVSFTLEERTAITLSMNMQMFAVIYGSQRNYLTATYSTVSLTLDAGTYYLLLIYMSTASSGYKVTVSINTAS